MVEDAEPLRQEKPERPVLPNGYRVVAVASDAWVLVAPGGLWIANYQGGLDLWRVALDARKHHQSGEYGPGGSRFEV